MNPSEPIHGTARVLGDRVEIQMSMRLGEKPPRAETPIETSGVIDKGSHGADFAAVRWGDRIFTFSPKQRLVVAALWQAREEGHGWLSQETLLEVAESDSGRLRDIFRNNPAWGLWIISGMLSGGPLGSYRLADDPRK